MPQISTANKIHDTCSDSQVPWLPIYLFEQVPNNDNKNALVTTVNYTNSISEEIKRDSIEKSIHRKKVLAEIVDYFRPSVL